MDWQPIATAPHDTDGCILGYVPALGICLMRWVDEEFAEFVGWDEPGWDMRPFGDFNCSVPAEGDDMPTHWAPLPTGPNGEPAIPV